MPNPDLIPEPFAQSGDKNPIPLERAITDPIYRASWKAGFPPDTRIPKDIGGEAPDGLDFNGVLNILSQAVVFLQKGNAYQFDAIMAPYPIGALVRSNDNLTTYQSTVPNNSNNPNSNMTGWRVYNGSGFIVDNLTTSDSTKALSAAQGKVLQDNKLGKTENAVSATKLQTARTINGVSFDGTANIALPTASTSVSGTVQLNNTLTSASATQALTAAQGKVIADAFTGTKSDNGYQNLYGGLIIQWGFAPKGSSGILPISFPIAFQNECLNIQTQLKHTSQNYQSPAVNNVTTTGFTVYWGNDAVGIFWFAIGY